MDHAIRMEKSTRLKPKPEAQEKLGFGKYFTDHMFLMDYSEELGLKPLRPRMGGYCCFVLIRMRSG
jgi:hypothetical protein